MHSAVDASRNKLAGVNEGWRRRTIFLQLSPQSNRRMFVDPPDAKGAALGLPDS